jgi:hypothetical protein
MSSPDAATSTAVAPKLDKEARPSSEGEAATARTFELP